MAEHYVGNYVGNYPGATDRAETNPIFPMTLDLRFSLPGKQARIEKPGLVP
jgi:hypothetical protein